jgi:2-(1,2-epoxy-1,2-dihydrophenyl)acetyl-CoA isomerase
MNEDKKPPTSPLGVELSEGIVTLTLQRPKKRNALDRQLVQELGQALRVYGADEAVRVILLTGSGGAFCAGADLASIESPKAEEIPGRIDEFHQLIFGIVETDKPVVALVDGPAVGFGADLALACDMRLFSEEGYLEEGFVKIGLMPDGGGTHFVPHFAGPRAFELLALGRRLSAQQCEALGIANQVVPPALLTEEGRKLARSLACSAPLALARIKRSLREAEREALVSALVREKKGQSALILSGDFQEGLNAFRNKRSPKFRGL